MSRRVDREIPGPDWRLWPEQVRGGDWSKIFGAPRSAPLDLRVDVGFGRGEFLLELARRHPQAAWVGIELDFTRVLKLTRQLARTPIRNVRLLGVAAEWSVREAFAPGSVSQFWINFPDPWPKRRHARRRIVAPRLIGELAGKLAPGGSVFVATDDAGYAGAVDEVLSGARGLENAHAPVRWRHRRDAPTTAFERTWQQRGRRCFYFAYRRPEAREAAQRR